MINANALNLLTVFGCILVSMTLHEAMHAFVSYWLGDDTAKIEGRLTLNPVAHIDPLTTVILPLLLVLAKMPPFGAAKPVPFNPHRVRFGDYGAAMVGFAGPLTNLLLAIITAVILQIFGLYIPEGFKDAIGTFIFINVSFFVFNMIPFPPLDGSRILYAFAPNVVRSFMESIEAMGFMAVVLFMMVFYLVLIDPFANVVITIVRLLIV